MQEVIVLLIRNRSKQITVGAMEPMQKAQHTTFYLGPRAGRARVSSRIRLANSQRVVAIARLSDNSFWSDSVDVMVTLAACLEDLR